jgi:hypothetical protein
MFGTLLSIVGPTTRLKTISVNSYALAVGFSSDGGRIVAISQYRRMSCVRLDSTFFRNRKYFGGDWVKIPESAAGMFREHSSRGTRASSSDATEDEMGPVL